MCDCDIKSYLYKETERKARKVRPCIECKRDIEVGDQYFSFVGKTSSGFWRAEVCQECEGDWLQVMAAFDDLETYELENICRCFGELDQTIDRAVGEGLLEEDDPLVIKWFGEIEEDLPQPPLPDERQLVLPYAVQEARP